MSRLEAQLLLERYPECGNLLLRPSGDGADDVSVTTRQTLHGEPRQDGTWSVCGEQEEVRPSVGAEPGQGAGSSPAEQVHPLTTARAGRRCSGITR